MPRKPKPSKPEPTASSLEPGSCQPVMSEQRIHPCKKKKELQSSKIVRRSSRLLSVVRPSPSAVKDIVMEPIPIPESEDEEDQHASPNKSEKSPVSDNLEKDMNHMDSETVNKQFKSKATKPSYLDENMNAEVTYKSLYLDSLKKVEALKEDNAALTKKLDFVLGKIEAYESLKDTVTHLKDIVLVAGLGRATEAAINLASQGTVAKFSLSGIPNGAAEPETAPNNVTKRSGAHVKKKK